MESGYSIQRSPSYKVAAKLKNLQYKLKEWNWQNFGNVKDKIITVKKTIEKKETLIQRQWNYDIESHEELVNLA